MYSHNQKYHSSHTQQQLFDIVADVKSYPEFIPWVTACRIKEIQGNVIIAQLMIKFKSFKGSYTSKVTLIPAKENGDTAKIDVELIEGPFKSLNNNWVFYQDVDDTTNIDFHVDFAFKSKLLGKMLNPIFGLATSKMLDAFEKRAKELHD